MGNTLKKSFQTAKEHFMFLYGDNRVSSGSAALIFNQQNTPVRLLI